MEYLRVRNWKRFQHYRDRCPPWIKLHNSLLDDYGYSCLQDDSKLLLISLFLLAARTNNKIPHDLAWIRNKSMLHADTIDLSPLLSSRFIEIIPDDSKMIAPRKQDDSIVLQKKFVSVALEEERRVEKRRTLFDPSGVAPFDVRINSIIKILYESEKWLDAPKFVGAMRKANKHPQSILDALMVIQKIPNSKIKGKTPWPLAQAIVSIKNGNYNEQEFRQRVETVKEQIPKTYHEFFEGVLSG